MLFDDYSSKLQIDRSLASKEAMHTMLDVGGS